jgi:putative ABC transport system ATP-binding protein
MNIIQIKDVSKTYNTGEIKVTALKSVNATIERGAFVCFVGPSGSGKTTLLNLIGCLSKSTEGSITVGGTYVNGLNRKQAAQFRGENLGFIFQDFNLIPVLTVYENVEYPLVMVKSVSKKERQERILDLLAKVGMLDQKNKYPHQISGGQKQRVAVARALVTNPKVVLADEPTANLDHRTAFKIIGVMKAMKESLNTTFIFSTHDPKIVQQAEIVFTLEDGQLVGKTKGDKLND